MKIFSKIIMVFLPLMATSCISIPSYPKLDQSFWKEQKDVVVIAMAEPEKAGAPVDYSNGLLGSIIGQIKDEKFNRAFGKYQYKGANQIAIKLKTIFENKGIKTKLFQKRINGKMLPKFENHKRSDYTAKDFSTLRPELEAETLLLITPSVKLIGNVNAFLSVEIIDLKTNKILHTAVIRAYQYSGDFQNKSGKYVNVNAKLDAMFAAISKKADRLLQQENTDPILIEN